MSEPGPARSEARLPEWFRIRIPATASGEIAATHAVIARYGLHTVCEQAHCPNIAGCYAQRTATFLILGNQCTRSCTFCAVIKHNPDGRDPDPDEPRRVAAAAAELKLRHVVITSVTRDDLPDGGAGQFVACAEDIAQVDSSISVEVLVPDFRGRAESVQAVANAPIRVFNHNLETVPTLYPAVRRGADYRRSLDVLRQVKQVRQDLLTKSGLMLGLGEEMHEIEQVLHDLREVDCDMLTLGQYLAPSRAHAPVARYLTPAEFEQLRARALEMGFAHVFAGPLVRSSLHAMAQLGTD